MKKIRNCGLAAVAALALTAVFGASVASASAFTALGVGGATTTLNGSPAAGVNLTLGGDSMKCTEAALSGTMVGELTPDITLTPQLSKCTWSGVSVNWVINECKLRFHSNLGALGLPRSVDITGCNKPMTFNSSGCQLEIGNQNRVGSVTYTTKEVEGKGTIVAAVNLEGLTYTRTGSCMSGLQGTFYDGKLSSEWTIKGKIGGSPLSVGVELTGAPAPSVFGVEETPATISGAKTNASSLSMWRFGPAGTLQCKTQAMSGTQSGLTSATLTLTPSFSNGCKFNGVEIPDGNIETGGCKLVFHLNSTLDIAGETCESNPIVVTRPGCLALVGPQTGLEFETEPYQGSPYVNSGSGRTRKVTVSYEGVVTGMKVTLTGPNCGGEGVFSTGWMQSLRPDRSPTLTATNSGGKPQGLSVE